MTIYLFQPLGEGGGGEKEEDIPSRSIKAVRKSFSRHLRNKYKGKV